MRESKPKLSTMSVACESRLKTVKLGDTICDFHDAPRRIRLIRVPHGEGSRVMIEVVELCQEKLAIAGVVPSTADE